MEYLIAVLRVIHIVNAILMAWPFYVLVIANHRARLGPPLGDRADIYMESIIQNRAIPCFIFQSTALVSGLALILLRGMGLGALISNPALGLKFLLLLLITAQLTYVHTRLHPQLDALFAQAGLPVPEDIATRITALRVRRKRLASICLFCVLTVAMLGVQVWQPFPVWLTVVLVLAIALFTWRSYRRAPAFGWV